MKLFVTVLTLPLFFSIAHAQVIDLGGVTVTEEQVNALQAAYPKTESDIIFYHWMDRTNGLRWISQKAIDEGEVNFYNIPTQTLQAYGPGIYLAKSSTSSKNFGVLAVADKVKTGTPIFDLAITQKMLNQTLTNDQLAILGEHIPFIRELTPGDWHVTNHYWNTKNLDYGGIHDPQAITYAPPTTDWQPAEILDMLNPYIKNGDGDAEYLKKILLTADYMDGISFARAMYANPTAPWNEFEPENFGKYEDAIRAADDLKKALPPGQGFQVKDIRDITKIIHTKAIGADTPLRTEGVRAGGTEIGGRFKATAAELSAMEANPFLTVEATPLDADGFSLVDYFYPDAVHYDKIKPYLSPQLVSDLDAAQKIEKGILDGANDDLRHSLNQRIESELVDKIATGTLPVDDLIDIHLYADDNGRTSRIVKGLFHNQPPHNFIGDYDTELSDSSYDLWVQKGLIARNNLHADLLDEFLMAKAQGRMPDYLKTGAVQRYVDTAFPMLDTIDMSDPASREKIRLRQWEDLIGKNQVKAAQEFLAVRKGRDLNSIAQELFGFVAPGRFDLYTPDAQLALLNTMDQLAKNKDLAISYRMQLIEQYEEYSSKLPAGHALVKPDSKTFLYDKMIDDLTVNAKTIAGWNDIQYMNASRFMKEIDADGMSKLNALNRQLLADVNLPTLNKSWLTVSYSQAMMDPTLPAAVKASAIPAREITNGILQSFVAETKKYPSQVISIQNLTQYLQPSREADYFMIHSLPLLDAIHQKQVKDFLLQMADQAMASSVGAEALLYTPAAQIAALQSQTAQRLANQIIESGTIHDPEITQSLLNRYAHYYQTLLSNAKLGKGKKLATLPRPGQLKIQVSGKDTYKNCIDGFLQSVF